MSLPAKCSANDIEHSPSCTSPDRLLVAAQTNRLAGRCQLSTTGRDSHLCFEDKLCFFVVNFRYCDFS